MHLLQMGNHVAIAGGAVAAVVANVGVVLASTEEMSTLLGCTPVIGPRLLWFPQGPPLLCEGNGQIDGEKLATNSCFYITTFSPCQQVRGRVLPFYLESL